ncbi:MAG TPA: DNA mismatch repair protein MutS, partial [Flavobacteriaceae bacterium]|nr:DNA mismatch repair protein MutS [Flavobacteriaceae bacterium]
MQNPLEFYQKEKQLFEVLFSKVKKQLTTYSMLRLFVFIVIVFGVYFFFGNGKAMTLIVLIGIAIFLFLVSKHTDLQHKKNKIQSLININETEIKVLNNDKTELDLGNEYKNSQHEFSYDIDLFGNGSFFQYLNRTAIKSGKDKLAKILSENTIDNIENKQKGLKELANKAKWRQNFSATASLVNVDAKDRLIVDWLQNHKNLLPKFIAYLPLLFFGISISLFVLNYFSFIGFGVIIAWFFIGLGVTGLFLKNTTILYQNANLAKDTFKQYHQLLLQIEREEFSSEILKEKQTQIKTENKKASAIFNDFSKTLDAFDQRNNIIFGIFGNAFALWDIKQSYKIELWIEKYHNQVEKWFEVIAFFDAQNSLANYVFNHPKHSFPKITNNNDFTIKAKQLGHPLLNKEKRIDNDFTIDSKEFFIITGANMAGKSTFLRTVSLSIVMANIGLPVCAKSFDYKPIHLITSMRTSDSLTDDESYFFSELKRLKFIVDAINPKTATKQYFIILDEILKGTNSKDKAIGSRKFVEKLVKSNSTGIIATHDLSLCEITNELPQVKNYYFDAEIINDELHFDYTFKNGICQNMNASF